MASLVAKASVWMETTMSTRPERRVRTSVPIERMRKERMMRGRLEGEKKEAREVVEGEGEVREDGRRRTR